VHIIDPTIRYDVGVFNLQWVTLTHSVPEAYALTIRTPVAKVFHTADWKLDPDPVIGEPYSEAEYRAIGDEGMDAMVCDSTNANVKGHSTSEAVLAAGLQQLIEQAPGRVVIGCFGSNLARMKTIYDIAAKCDRHVSLLGRSMINMAAAAKKAGIWPEQRNIVDSGYLAYMPQKAVIAVATGSQGEPRTALYRLSHDNFHDLSLEPGDTVIFSSRAIPGNEQDIESLIARLEALGVTVITQESTELEIHASGHPAMEELEKMYQWIRPDMAIPVHGEPLHLRANGKIANATGVPRHQIGKNGDIFYIAPYRGIRRNAVKTGRLGLKNRKLSPIKD
jgi:ribonuclease J